jgi:hypothetical protein
MHFNGMFQIMNVDELNMKLVFIMLNILQLIIPGNFKRYLPELIFKAGDFFAVFTHLFAPGVALCSKL